MPLNLLDFIIAALVLLALLKGMRQGLLGALSGMAGLVAGFILAAYFSHDLAAVLDKNFAITGTLSAWLKDALPLAALAPGPVGKLPGLGEAFQEASVYLAENALHIFSFIMLVIAGSLAVQWIGQGLNRLLSGTPFSLLNRILGAVLEAAKVVIIVIILLGLLVPSFQMGARLELPAAKTVCRYIDRSLLCTYGQEAFRLCQGWIGLDA